MRIVYSTTLPPITHLDKVALKPEFAIARTGPQFEPGVPLSLDLHHHHAVAELLDKDWTEGPAVDIFLDN